jgi:CSLREA domain-containing protein
MRRLSVIVVGGCLAVLGWVTAISFGFGISDGGLTPGSARASVAAPHPKSASENPKSGHPWIHLRESQDLATVYLGATGVKQTLAGGLAVPTALASADFDEDGVPDLISGYVGPGGGLLALHRGNVDFLWRRHQGSGRGDSSTGDSRSSILDPQPFHAEAGVFELPEPPDFLGAGDFDADGHWDVVAAARGSDNLYLLPGDGRGGVHQAQPIAVPGAVTALVVGEINRADGLADVVVGVVGADGPQALVFEGPEGALKATPEAFSLPAEPAALALGQLDDRYEMDLAVAAGSELVIVQGRDRKLSLDDIRQAQVPPASIERRAFPFEIRSLALGDFIWDQEHQTEIALLADDGTVHLLEKAKGNKAKDWLLVENITLPLASDGENIKSAIRHPPSAIGLVRAKLSSLPTDDLLVLDQATHQLHILASQRVNESTGQRVPDSLTPFPIAPVTTVLDTERAVVAVLPMRVNVDALNDLVMLREGASVPTVALTAAAMTFTVNSTADTGDATPDGVCDDGAGNCTLREAIQEANANMGADMITFNIPGNGPHTIQPTSALPTITDLVTIDATMENACGSPHCVELDGSMAGSANGLRITGGSSTVRGLVINRFSGTFPNGNGIRLETTGGNIIENCFIGTDVTGTLDLGNPGDGVQISGTPGNTIGGTTAGARNVIFGNNDDGVQIEGSAATGNQVQGNFIGTDVTGTLDLDNSGDGVVIFNRASNNRIGGATAGARNVISGNARGVFIITSGTMGNQVQGNFIGTDVTGTLDLGNRGDGVQIEDGSNNTIGGTTAGARNVISGNDLAGVRIFDSDATGNQVQGNFIGTDVNGTAALGNSVEGVVIFSAARSNTIGGTASGAGNTIAFNGDDGIVIRDGFSIRNAINQNSIFSNGGLGIDLDSSGVTANDAGDGDGGSNNRQNFPDLTSVSSSGGSTIISGSIDSLPGNSTYPIAIEFFGNPTCDSSGHGEGQHFLGSLLVNGPGSFTANLPTSMPAGDMWVTATATDANGNTSEFSACVLVQFCTITCPADITRSTDPGQCGATVTYSPPMTSGSCGPVTCTPSSGSFFPKGTAMVTCTFPGGPSCSFTVTVNDTQSPTLTCPGDVTTLENPPGSGGAMVTYSAPTVSDNCPGVRAPTCMPASGSTFPVGTTTVMCNVMDAVGNSQTCSFTVTVQSCSTLTCPADITRSTDPGQCGATVTYSPPTSGSCGPVTCSPPSGSFFPTGTTTITCTISGGPSCSFTITVNDTQSPTLTCPGDVTTLENPPGSGGAMVTYSTPTANDNCPGVGAPTCMPASGFTFPVGTTTVMCNVMDAAGNSQTCSFSVTVQSCTIVCPANITRSTDPGQCGATVTYSPPMTSGSCGPVTCSPPSGSFFPTGTTTITCTISGGPSCSFTITVNDTQGPTLTCPGDVTTLENPPGSGGAMVTYSTPTANDNCPGVGAPTCMPASGSTFPVGTTTVMCNVMDAVGNNQTCSFTVTVQSCTIVCPANVTVQTINTSQCGATVTYPAPTTTGNCGAVTCTPPSGSVFPVGTTTVTCTTSAGPSCSFTVTVKKVFVLADDRNGHCLTIQLLNCTTGAGRYVWCQPDGRTISGPCTVSIQGNVVTVQSTAADANLLQAGLDLGRRTGTARLNAPRDSRITLAIMDSNVANSTCHCP